MFKRLIISFSHAIDGLRYLLHHEHNFRIHVAAALCACVLAAWLRFSLVEWTVLVALIGLVMLAEAFNTSIERTIDCVVKHYDRDAKIAKDTAAAGVMLMAMGALVAGVLLFGVKIYRMFWG